MTVTTPETESPKHPFERGLELYEQKASYDEIIPLFEQGITLDPRDSVGYTCLAWLLLLRNSGDDAAKGVAYATKAVRLDPANTQAHFNLVLGMLMTGAKGVRQEFQRAMGKLRSEEEQAEVIGNLKDALERQPELDAAAKILNWMQAG